VKRISLLPESLAETLTGSPAWKIEKEYAGVLLLLVELPRSPEELLGPLLELSTLDGEPLSGVAESMINTLEMARIDIKGGEPVLTGPGLVELLARLGDATHFALPLLKRRSSEAEGRITVGRASSNDVVLVEPSVSNRHAWFSTDPHGSLTIQDAGSKNGTRVDGRRILPDEVVWVQPMDQIKFGSLSTFTCMPGVLRGVLKTLEMDTEG
jgi:FHA domain